MDTGGINVHIKQIINAIFGQLDYLQSADNPSIILLD